jgi:hypothetical protein
MIETFRTANWQVCTRRKGSPPRPRVVARKLTDHDAFVVYIDAELGIDPDHLSNTPWVVPQTAGGAACGVWRRGRDAGDLRVGQIGETTL